MKNNYIMKLQRIVLSFLTGVILFILGYILLEKFFDHSTDTISAIILKHWKSAVGLSLLTTFLNYIFRDKNAAEDK
jgi:hypothetical protein